MTSLYVYLPKDVINKLSDKIPGISKDANGIEQEMLNSIDSLNIKDIDVMYLSYFKNLKTVIIDSFPDIDDRTFYYVARNCPNITNLIIKNQPKLNSIDLSGLKNLKNLTIVSNENLINIDGMDEKLINNLDTLEFYDNLNYPYYADLVALLKKCKIKDVKIDALYYIDLKKGNNHNVDSYKWHEKIGYRNQRNISYSSGEMDATYQNVISIVKSIINDSDSDNMKISIIYSWIIKNIRMVEQRKGSINEGIVNALRYGEASMPTMGKLLQFMLKAAGVDSYDVNIFPKVRFNNSYYGTFKIPGEDYAIIKVNTDEGTRYFDIVWDADIYKRNKKICPLFMFNGLDDISYNHMLIFNRDNDKANSMDINEREDYLRKAEARLKVSEDKVLESATEDIDEAYRNILHSHRQLKSKMENYQRLVDGIKDNDKMVKAVKESNRILRESIFRLEESLLDRLILKDIETIESIIGMKITPFTEVKFTSGPSFKTIKNKEELNIEWKRARTSLNRNLVDGNLGIKDYRSYDTRLGEIYTYLITFAYENAIVVDTLDISERSAKKAG